MGHTLNRHPDDQGCKSRLMCVLQRGVCRGKPVAGAPANAMEVLSKMLSGDKLNKARQVVGNLLHPNVQARTALADVDITFLLE